MSKIPVMSLLSNPLEAGAFMKQWLNGKRIAIKKASAENFLQQKPIKKLPNLKVVFS